MSCHSNSEKSSWNYILYTTVFFAWKCMEISSKSSFLLKRVPRSMGFIQKQFKNMQVRRSPPRSLETLWLGQEWSSTARALPAPHGGIFLWKLRLQRAIAPHYHGVNYDKLPCSNFPCFHVRRSFFTWFLRPYLRRVQETFQLSWAPFSPFLSDRHLDTHLNRWGVRDAIPKGHKFDRL